MPYESITTLGCWIAQLGNYLLTLDIQFLHQIKCSELTKVYSWIFGMAVD